MALRHQNVDLPELRDDLLRLVRLPVHSLVLHPARKPISGRAAFQGAGQGSSERSGGPLEWGRALPHECRGTARRRRQFQATLDACLRLELDGDPDLNASRCEATMDRSPRRGGRPGRSRLAHFATLSGVVGQLRQRSIERSDDFVDIGLSHRHREAHQTIAGDDDAFIEQRPGEPGHILQGVAAQVE